MFGAPSDFSIVEENQVDVSLVLHEGLRGGWQKDHPFCVALATNNFFLLVIVCYFYDSINSAFAAIDFASKIKQFFRNSEVIAVSFSAFYSFFFNDCPAHSGTLAGLFWICLNTKFLASWGWRRVSRKHRRKPS